MIHGDKELSNYELLYRTVFDRTNGFVLCWPIGSQVRIGDFFTVKPYRMNVAGNVFDRDIELNVDTLYELDRLVYSAPVLEPFDSDKTGVEVFKPSTHLWKLMSGCNSDYFSKNMIDPHKKKLKPREVNTFEIV